MSNLTVFQFESQDIRTVMIDNEPWFVAKDVCAVLEVGNSRHALTRLDDDEKGVALNDTLGGKQELAVISESGLYALVLSSRKPQAKPFRKWVTSEVIPSIRKTGGYGVIKTPQTYIEALEAIIVAEKEKELLRLESEQLKEENLALAEAVDELFDYSSIIRVAKWNNLSEKDFKWRALKRASKEMGEEVKQVPCPRFGTKNLYSHNVWRYCYPNVSLPETTTLVIKPS